MQAKYEYTMLDHLRVSSWLKAPRRGSECNGLFSSVKLLAHNLDVTHTSKDSDQCAKTILEIVRRRSRLRKKPGHHNG